MSRASMLNWVAGGCVASTCLAGSVATAAEAPPREHRALWAGYRSYQTPEALAQTVERATTARLNAIYALVWYQGGQATYRSALAPLMQGTAADFDPLGALITAAHARDIQVHAWFVNGSYGQADPGHVFPAHPDWALQDGQGGRERWYDLGRPEVRRFQRDVMLECLANYDLDGIHFDYIRYNGPGSCACSHCQGELQRRFGVTPPAGDGSTFPLVLQVGANPVDRPSGATVLARFSRGVPAVTLNSLGQGETALINWSVVPSGNPAVTGLVRQLLQRFGSAGGIVYQVRGSQTLTRYGDASQQSGLTWLRGLGCQPRVVREDQLTEIPAGATVIMQAQYYVPAATAAWLVGHVEAGGHALFLDGPVFAMREPALQRVLGMTGTAPYFSALEIIRPEPGQELIPVGPEVDLEAERHRASAWAAFRTESVTDLVRLVYRDAKALKPAAQVSAAVFYRRASAELVCQDWPGWLREGIVDYVIPMAYTLRNEDLTAALDEWRTIEPTLARILPGISIYTREGTRTTTRDADLVLTQQGLCRVYRAPGTCFFSAEQLSAELAAALGEGPYRTPATPFYPAR